MMSATPDYGLKPGQQLVDCNKGFTWAETVANMGPTVPTEVRVVEEYPSFVVVEANFRGNGGSKYRSCINKAAVVAGDCYFRALRNND